MKILVTGGKGYIGSHMIQLLLDNNYQVVAIDNQTNNLNKSINTVNFYQGNISNIRLIKYILKEEKIDAVIHFAGSIEVGESIVNPGKFYKNNVANTISLLNCMINKNVKNLIFSSSAAIYGDPLYSPIDEAHPKNPINAYGQSKWILEQIFLHYEKAYNLNHISLRYFNAAGAHINGHLGEQHYPETHLIPLIFEVAKGKHNYINVYGNDYPTPDGTCVRDYIHVQDLCIAHLQALEHLNTHKKSGSYNLGTGKGYSVKEIIEKVSEVTEKEIPIKIAPRRSGDPAYLVANAFKANQELNWHPIYSDLDTIIRTAWRYSLNSDNLKLIEEHLHCL